MLSCHRLCSQRHEDRASTVHIYIQKYKTPLLTLPPCLGQPLRCCLPAAAIGLHLYAVVSTPVGVPVLADDGKGTSSPVRGCGRQWPLPARHTPSSHAAVGVWGSPRQELCTDGKVDGVRLRARLQARVKLEAEARERHRPVRAVVARVRRLRVNCACVRVYVCRCMSAVLTRAKSCMFFPKWIRNCQD